MITKATISGLALGAALALGVATTAAQATTIYATSVDNYAPGTGITDPARTITANALGAADGAFLSLGLGGSATFSFGTVFAAPIRAFEVTFGTRLNHEEIIEVFAGYMGSFTSVGFITNLTGVDDLDFAGYFDQLKLVDISPAFAGRDGFDIDAIAVSPVPLPAGGLLLLTALGAGAALRRRKQA